MGGRGEVTRCENVLDCKVRAYHMSVTLSVVKLWQSANMSVKIW